ncbi:spore germination protein KA [Kroppenstedtia sanguinis]|uniref:Spore germination protein n=1 Tax=Kroppenstedtia sanguinis TaxID=1380684 RepID=A0ABW4C6Z8_9BACL
MSWWKRWFKGSGNPSSDLQGERAVPEESSLDSRLEEVLRQVSDLLGENDDLVIRRFSLFGQREAALIYFSTLVEPDRVHRDILKPLMRVPAENEEVRLTEEDVLGEVLHFGKYQIADQLSDVVDEILKGSTAVWVDGFPSGILLETRNVEKRSVSEPQSERVLRGSREGFIEQLDANLSLLRYRLPNPNFTVKRLTIGTQTRSKVAYCYLQDVVQPALVREVEDRLQAIEIDGVLESGYLEQFIEDHHLSPFPQVANTERPDVAVSQLLEGRVIILVEGSPFVLMVPVVFAQFYQTLDDYSERFLIGSLIRLIRLLAILSSLFFPAIYVSLVSFHPELIPTDFAVAVAGGRAGVPFPAIAEVLFVEISMEILREASIRLPQQMGSAFSIIGILVVGQAAVAAGFASPITVVIVALTTIGSFAAPAYNISIAFRMLRFPILILSGIFGLYGVMVGAVMIANHMLSLRSFGVPYLTPISPENKRGWLDTLIRAPFWMLSKRPAFLHPLHRQRVGMIRRLKKARSNTLDPIKVGNERREPQDGI